jgi:hypothetical protein
MITATFLNNLISECPHLPLGFPAALNGLAAAKEVFKERDDAGES